MQAIHRVIATLATSAGWMAGPSSVCRANHDWTLALPREGTVGTDSPAGTPSQGTFDTMPTYRAARADNGNGHGCRDQGGQGT